MIRFSVWKVGSYLLLKAEGRAMDGGFWPSMFLLAFGAGIYLCTCRVAYCDISFPPIVDRHRHSVTCGQDMLKHKSLSD